MLPVREGRHDDPVQIVQDGVEGFRGLGWLRGQSGLDLSRRGAGHDGALTYGGAVVGNAVDDLVAEAAKFFRGHRVLLK